MYIQHINIEVISEILTKLFFGYKIQTSLFFLYCFYSLWIYIYIYILWKNCTSIRLSELVIWYKLTTMVMIVTKWGKSPTSGDCFCIIITEFKSVWVTCKKPLNVPQSYGQYAQIRKLFPILSIKQKGYVTWSRKE